MPLSREQRIALAKRRITNILRKHIVATMRTLEQKISDAGPTNQRIDPHLLTRAREELEEHQTLIPSERSGVPWFHLAETHPTHVDQRLKVLEPIHNATADGQFAVRLG
jgi:hypothetical protein